MVTTVTQPERMKQVANDTIDAVEATTLDHLEGARDAAISATDKAHQIETDLHKTVQETTDKVTQFIHEKPLQAAGIAFAAGILTTLILRKR